MSIYFIFIISRNWCVIRETFFHTVNSYCVKEGFTGDISISENDKDKMNTHWWWTHFLNKATCRIIFPRRTYSLEHSYMFSKDLRIMLLRMIIYLFRDGLGPYGPKLAQMCLIYSGSIYMLFSVWTCTIMRTRLIMRHVNVAALLSDLHKEI